MELKKWHNFVNTLWQFIKKHNAPESDADWREVFRDAEQINVRYNDQKVFRKILFDVIERWEEETNEKT